MSCCASPYPARTYHPMEDQWHIVHPWLTPKLCSKRTHRLSKHVWSLLRNRRYMSSLVQEVAPVYSSCLLGWAQSVIQRCMMHTIPARLYSADKAMTCLQHNHDRSTQGVLVSYVLCEDPAAIGSDSDKAPGSAPSACCSFRF
jgi:hypothetical protein